MAGLEQKNLGPGDAAQYTNKAITTAKHALEEVPDSLETVPNTELENLCCGLKSRREPVT